MMWFIFVSDVELLVFTEACFLNKGYWAILKALYHVCYRFSSFT